jgi:hypothetical protein
MVGIMFIGLSEGSKVPHHGSRNDSARDRFEAVLAWRRFMAHSICMTKVKLKDVSGNRACSRPLVEKKNSHFTKSTDLVAAVYYVD